MCCAKRWRFFLGGGTFLDAWSRSRLLAKGPVVVLWADPETILRRVESLPGQTRPMLAGLHQPLERIQVLLAERTPLYRQGHIHVWTQNRNREDIVEEIVYKLWQYRYGQRHET
ncbi:MAG: shikimate kinase [Deinococcaceae bacterium]